jgi:hypothetical protein
MQRLSDTLCILALAVHPQPHSGKAAIQHPAFIRLQDVTEQNAHEPQLLDQRRVLAKDHPREHIAVTGEIFGR